MIPDERTWAKHRLTRRAAMGAAALAATGALAQGDPRAAGAERAVRPKYDMKKSINLWAFPYPDQSILTFPAVR